MSPSPTLPRPRLLARFDPTRPLTVVRAPSGYGKTMLVGQWVRAGLPAGTPVAWSRLPRTRAPAAAWGAIAAALMDAGLHFPPGARDTSARIARALADADAPITLVVDDLDHAPEEVDDDLLELVRYAPALRLVVCLRTATRLPVHQILDLGATTIDAPELLFTADEVALLAGRPETAEMTHTQCGGWPALTRAVLHQLTETGEPADVPAVIDQVSHHYVTGRLLPASASPQKRELAVTTAIAEHVTRELAEQLAESMSARTVLDEILAEGLFTVRAADGEATYAWPPAVRRALAAEADRLDPDRLVRVHRRLAHTYESCARPDLALHHGLLARDWRHVVKTVDANWRTLLVHHRATLAAAATAAPVQHLRKSRRATAMRDVMLQATDDTMLSTDTLPHSPQALDELGRSDEAPEAVDTALAVLVALRNCAPVEQARDYAARLLRLARTARQAHPARLVALYPGVLSQVGVTYMYADDFRAAVEPIREAYRRADDGQFDYLARETASKLALIHAVDGDLQHAEVWLDRYDAAPTSASWLSTLIDPVPKTAQLLTALDRLDLTGAAQVADTIVRHVYPERAWTWPVFARGLLALHTGTATDALDHLTQARTATAHGVERSVVAAPLLTALEADLLLSLGRGGQARAVLEGEHGRHPALRTGQARLALLTGDPNTALRLLGDPAWEQAATARQRHESLLLQAVAAHRIGDESSAVHALQQAAAASEATGSLRAFTMAPRADLDALARHVPLARTLLASEPLATQPDPFPPAVSLITLTPRERLVLHKLAAGLNLREAAAALVVSYNTIRTQQASLYRKLGVNDRAEAIARARQHGLL